LEKSALDPATLRKRRPGKMKQMREPVVAPVSPRTVSTDREKVLNNLSYIAAFPGPIPTHIFKSSETYFHGEGSSMKQYMNGQYTT
jgi:hypothetical protein